MTATTATRVLGLTADIEKVLRSPAPSAKERAEALGMLSLIRIHLEVARDIDNNRQAMRAAGSRL